MKLRELILLFYLTQILTGFSTDFKPVSLNDSADNYFLHSQKIKYFIDSDSLLNPNNLSKNLNQFKVSPVSNLFNEETHNVYWLYFKVLNNSIINNYMLELYDFNIDEVQIVTFKNSNLYTTNHSGYSFPFDKRVINHKNFCYPLSLTRKDTIEVFMGIKSNKHSLLEPVIRSNKTYINYILKEYYILGLFYGILVLVIIYNLIYLFIVKEKTYFFYVLYLIFIGLFFLSQDGLGFQYIWPRLPLINQHIETLSLSLATITLLWVSKEFLDLNTTKTRLILFIISLISGACIIDIFIVQIPVFRIILFTCFQICLFLGIVETKNNFDKNRWFTLSFLLLDLFYFIELLEKLDIIESGIFTVYALNLGVVLQYISLSIGLMENSKNHLLEKNKALKQLLTTQKENDALRLIELKRQMNPHFLFNALNSIQSRILVNNTEDASTLLVKFSQLLRKNLEISDVQFITLDEEIKLIKNYLEIEKIRLGGTFNYKISIDSKIDIEKEQIPTFLIQPLVENAVWHGFSKKNKENLLSIEIKSDHDSTSINIIDNGKGIKSVNKEQTKNHKSKGLSIVNERLSLIKKTFDKEVSLEIVSPYKENGTGTLAKITIWK